MDDYEGWWVNGQGQGTRFGDEYGNGTGIDFEFSTQTLRYRSEIFQFVHGHIRESLLNVEYDVTEYREG